MAITNFTPYKWQEPAWKDKSPTLLLTGAAGGGKSRLAGEKFHAFMLKYPGSTGIIGRKDRTSAMRSVVPLMLYTVIGDTKWGRYHKSDGMFEYSNGSMAWIVGVRDESQREGLRSIGKDGSADISWFEEANKLTEADDSEITARMRGNAAGWRQKMYTTNPDAPTHWIKRKLIDQEKASVYYSRPEDNPKNPPDYLEALQALTGVWRQRLWEGLWVQAEGVIYTAYDSTKHLYTDKIATPFDGYYVISIDFGFTNPFSATLWRIMTDDPTDLAAKPIYQIEQIYKSRVLVEDHAETIRKMLVRRGIPIQHIKAWVCDHDAEGRATLEKHLGIRTIAAHKAIKEGIEAVQSRFSSNLLFLNEYAVKDIDDELEKKYQPTSTVDEISAYSWSDKKQDTPIDLNNHGLDEMRYMVAWVDKLHKRTAGYSTAVTIKNYISGRH